MAVPHPPARKRKMPERKKLNVGQFIASEKDAYKIESILGSGGFGDVYKVIVVKDESKKYAMKTEYFDPRKRKLLNRLKVEMGVFTEIQHMPPDRRKHFIQMVDKGQTDQFKFIVMEIVSHSLEDIRKYMLNGKLSWSTAIRVASQTVVAISDLHSVGYIHRDIKPHNFAIGRAPMQAQIYMLDFGIARRFTEKDGKIRVPRERVTFLGTVKFASRQCHLEQEQSRKDDLEVWIYMVLELFEQENLIWRRQTDRSQILALKERLFSHTDELDLRMPTGFKKIMEYVKRLAFADEPDYAYLVRTLSECAKTDKIDVTQPLDWIDKTMPEKNKVKKKASHARLENDDDSVDRRRRQRLEEKAKQRAAEKKEKVSEGKEESEDEDDEDEEDKDKKESQGPSEGGDTGKKTEKNKQLPRKSMSRGVNKNKKEKSRETKENDGDRRPFEKRADAGASKLQRLSKKQATSDTQVSHQGHVKSPPRKSPKRQLPSPKRISPKRHSERKKKSARRAKSRPRSSKQKRKTSEKDNGGKPKVSVRAKTPPPPVPSGPPLKNVSVMIMPEGPADANYVKSGYIALDMGPAGKK